MTFKFRSTDFGPAGPNPPQTLLWVFLPQVRALVSLGLLIGVNIVLGLMPYVDNFAHLGGLIAGLLLGFALLAKRRRPWGQNDNLEISPPQDVIRAPPGNILAGGNRGVQRHSKAQLVGRGVAGVLFCVG